MLKISKAAKSMSLGVRQSISGQAVGPGTPCSLGLPYTHLACAKRFRTSPMVSSGRIISRKACSPFSDLMRSMESGGTGISGDSWILQIKALSAPRSSPPHPAPTSLPCPHLWRSEAKAGVSTMISWIRAGIGQQFWKAATWRVAGAVVPPESLAPLRRTGSFLSRDGWGQ